MKKILFLLVIAASLISCYKSGSKETFDMSKVLQPDSMVSLLTDLHIADGIINTTKDKKLSTEYLASEYFEVIMEKHHIDKGIFEESIRYYAYHTEEFNNIYEKVVSNLSLQENVFNKLKDTIPPSE